MRQKLVWRYWCEHCGKGGCGKGAMRKHEERCTLNPNRKCGVCRNLLEQESKPLPELIAMLPKVTEEEMYCPEEDVAEEIDLAQKRVFTASGECPACTMAALRQAKIPVLLTTLDFKGKMQAIWHDINQNNAREY